MNLKELQLYQFIRYGLTGFSAVAVLLILPLIVLSPNVINYALSCAEVLGITLISFIIGYLIDALKVYQLSLSHSKLRHEFLTMLEKELNVPENEASLWFTVANDIAYRFGRIDLARKQAEWIMADHVAKIFGVGCIFWIGFILWSGIVCHSIMSLIIPVVLMLFLAFGTLRMFVVSKQERMKSNAMYIKFAAANRDFIQGSFRIQKKQPEE